MARQAIVIGLGQFGMAVARALSTEGVDVLAVDVREERVRAAASFVADAACFDATDADALARTSPERRDVALCAIGDEAKDASIICTALLRQMGSKRVIARANDDVHGRILSLVGAHEVVNPERIFGERFASQIIYGGIRGEMSLGDDLMISEIDTPKRMAGRTLAELELPRRYGVTVIAVRRGKRGAVVTPNGTTALAKEDMLIVVAKKGSLADMLEREST